ncbi:MULTISPECIES: TlpA family protein disulfide reductase [unclassified Pseudoclavibacter]|uniref:TlpA family protein disulfide reductase n=1 Tax=unclassified Pseudoclavibacter TaxID=2615177 RepID=UPI0027DC7BFA|nr:TlpA disulfide reductase family protein [Pseudoclavibacter sp. Marseille-Q4354]
MTIRSESVKMSRSARPLRVAFASLGVAAMLLLAACAPSEDLADQARDAGAGTVASDGSYEIFPAEERQAPIEFGGITEFGDELSSEDLAGSVTVVNFWYAACPPCRLEAPDLQALWEEHEGDGVEFVGVNIYDQAATAKAFAETQGITYPSILDVDDASVRLAFADNVPPQAIPSTLVLDAEGRVASVIRGPIDPSILGSMITDTLAESSK